MAALLLLTLILAIACVIASLLLWTCLLMAARSDATLPAAADMD